MIRHFPILVLALTAAVPAVAESPFRPLPPEDPRAAAALAILADGPLANPTDVTVEAAQAGVDAAPRDADAWHQLGESLEVAGRLPEAVEAYRRAAGLPPRVIGRAYLNRDLAAALEEIGHYEDALAAARIAVRSWPISQDGLHCTASEARLLARLLVRTQGLAAAADFYRPLQQRSPDREDYREILAALEGK